MAIQRKEVHPDVPHDSTSSSGTSPGTGTGYARSRTWGTRWTWPATVRRGSSSGRCSKRCVRANVYLRAVSLSWSTTTTTSATAAATTDDGCADWTWRSAWRLHSFSVHATDAVPSTASRQWSATEHVRTSSHERHASIPPAWALPTSTTTRPATEWWTWWTTWLDASDTYSTACLRVSSEPTTYARGAVPDDDGSTWPTTWTWPSSSTSVRWPAAAATTAAAAAARRSAWAWWADELGSLVSFVVRSLGEGWERERERERVWTRQDQVDGGSNVSGRKRSFLFLCLSMSFIVGSHFGCCLLRSTVHYRTRIDQRLPCG